eukprot:TRINITY_DN56250_c0_g1_i1.p1 TRINITY_DN56250_c0_g1~~TRINITY_DN56250_c0_g1_i1.p1  ORF type:complete len:201 (+),score=38.77 TRINITY_DN56250_c0_g1_i1:118-720(+)
MRLILLILAFSSAGATKYHALKARSTLVAAANKTTDELPDVCKALCSSASESDCPGLYDQCACCVKALRDKILTICSSFGGRTDCADNIQKAIDKKREDCKLKRAADEKERQEKLKKIGEAIKDKVGYNPLAGITKLQREKDQSALGPYDLRCHEYAKPSCHKFDGLCGFTGCNKDVWTLTNELSHIELWYKMYKGQTCR